MQEAPNYGCKTWRSDVADASLLHVLVLLVVLVLRRMGVVVCTQVDGAAHLGRIKHHAGPRFRLEGAFPHGRNVLLRKAVTPAEHTTRAMRDHPTHGKEAREQTHSNNSRHKHQLHKHQLLQRTAVSTVFFFRAARRFRTPPSSPPQV